MKVTLGIDFDFGHWPGPLAGRDASAGEAWVGPAGMLSILETLTGLAGPSTPAVLRSAGLVPAVLETEGFWSRSADHNPLATARTLLRWRDRLWLHGWRGEALTERLGALARVTEGAEPGLPDRLELVATCGAAALGDIAEVTLSESRGSWAPLWQATFSALEWASTQVHEQTVELLDGSGDLGQARAAFARALGSDAFLAGDGSLQLLRPYGPVQAAEEVATWLASLEALDGVVIVGGDPLLDRALERHGLPTTGARSDGQGALLQILPLVLALGWKPPDPQRALELLTLPITPVRWAVRKGLADALAEWPAVGSEAWEKKLRQGLAEIEDEATRRSTAERLETMLRPAVPRGEHYPAAEAIRRAEAVQQWLAARKATDDDSLHHWDGALAQCRTFLALVEASGLEALSAPQLDRFADQASRGASEPAPYPAQAGIGAIRRPGGIVGPARHVVWWGFDLGSAQRVPAWPFSPATLAKLESGEIGISPPGQEALSLAERWRRPLLCATESVLFVCPQTGLAGDGLYPHPLWDEIVGHVGETGAERLVGETPRFRCEPERVRFTFRDLPASRREWTADPERLGPRKVESLSGLGDFLGCSLRWALKYHAQLWPGRSNQTSSEAALLGSLLHEIVERTLLEQPENPEVAGERARELFDELAPKLAAPFYLPGADAVRGQARRLAKVATRRLAQILAADGRRVTGAEDWLMKDWLTEDGAGSTLGGRLDLVVGDPPGIIDLKLGSGRWHRQDLKNGISGLAIYSYLLREEGEPYPPYGYFILRDQMLLSTDDRYFSNVDHIAGPGPEETFRAWERATASRRRTIDQGRLEAPGNPDAAGLIHPEEKAIVDGRIVLEPPCHWCDHKALCGKQFAETDG